MGLIKAGMGALGGTLADLSLIHISEAGQGCTDFPQVPNRNL